jgi:hypothetical protein
MGWMTNQSLFDIRQGKEILSSLNSPDWVSNEPKFLFDGYQGLFLNGKAA